MPVTAAYNAATHTLTDTSTSPLPVGAVRVAVATGFDGATTFIPFPTASSAVVLKLGTDGVYGLAIAYRGEDEDVLGLSPNIDVLHKPRLDALCHTLYRRHATSRPLIGAAETHIRAWRLRYAAQVAFQEGDYATAQAYVQQVPVPEYYPAVLPGAPGLPFALPGVAYEDVDGRRIKLNLALHVQPDAITASVARQTADGTFTAAVPITLDAELTTDPDGNPVLTGSFAAPLDGLYRVTLRESSTSELAPPVLATFTVPVARAVLAQAREDNRTATSPLRARVRPADDEHLLRLVLLRTGTAAADTNQNALAARLLSAARQVPAEPTPTALFPRLPRA